MWNIGKSDNGRDMFVCAVSSTDTIKKLEKYRQNMLNLADPRTLGFPANEAARADVSPKFRAAE
jgi:hypothetical protein